MESDSIRILVVDDEESFRFFLRKGLSRRGFVVREAENGKQGLAEAESFRPDVVFADLKMPEMDGLEFLERLKSRQPQTIVILMTAYATIPIAIRAIRGGAAEFLTKPFELPEVTAVLDKALEDHELRMENLRLRALLVERSRFEGLVGSSPAMRTLYAVIEQVARTESTVLVRGESGTGKELVARAIHARSGRADRPFLAVHCAAIPETLFESEIFGHLPGAFTGATSRKEGLFERAHGGTVFLDEVATIPLPIQAKLLRALQEREIQPLGATEPVRIDVRWVAATNRDLEAMVERGEFREDLFFRLNVIPMCVPPLRERFGDIPILVDHFVRRREGEATPPKARFSPEAMRALEEYPWPGNVRELENLVERLLALCGPRRIEAGDLPREVLELGSPPGGFPGFAEARERFEKRYLFDLLRNADGVVTRAAEIAGLSRQALHAKIRALGIDPARFRR